jgi:spore maturation protein SpmA
MNKIFTWLIAIAFVCAAARQLLVMPSPIDAHLADHVGWARFGDPWSFLVGLRSLVDLPLNAAGAKVLPMDDLTSVIFDQAKKAVLDVALKMAGGMTLMLGVMKVMEQGGGLAIMGKLIRPLMVRAFPDVPPNHPAMGAMIMNLAANALGLGNAATPFGIKAMQELDKLNPHKGTATNAMALFLAINTSGVTLLATGAVVLRRETGSHDPSGIIGTTLFATMCSTIAAIIACKLLERVVPAPPATDPIDASDTEHSDEPYPLWVSILFLCGVFAFVPLSILYGETISPWLIPLIVVGFLGFGYARGVPVYEAFVEGAKDGFAVATRIIPFLVGILVMVGMLTSSGAMDAFTGLVGPITSPLGLPAEALPMALIRPLSGSGATGVMTAILSDKSIGPDSYTGFLVSTIAGSTETTFYVLAVYYGAVQIKRIRHSMACGLVADVVGVIGSIVAVQAYFAFYGLPR